MNELLQKVEKAIARQPYACLLGLQAESAEEGRAVIVCHKRSELLQQMGTLHGGVIGGMCEAAAAYAAETMLPEGMDMVGVEYKISILRPVTADTVRTVAKVVKMGRQLVTVDVEAFNDGSDKIAAKMLFTGMLVEKK